MEQDSKDNYNRAWQMSLFGLVVIFFLALKWFVNA